MFIWPCIVLQPVYWLRNMSSHFVWLFEGGLGLRALDLNGLKSRALLYLPDPNGHLLWKVIYNERVLYDLCQCGLQIRKFFICISHIDLGGSKRDVNDRDLSKNREVTTPCATSGSDQCVSFTSCSRSPMIPEKSTFPALSLAIII